MAGIGSLPLFHRVRGTRVVVVGAGDMAEAKRRLVERAGGIPCSEAEAHHSRLAFVALDDEREAKAAALRLKGKGLLVNVADMPELCDFTLPSILDREPVLVAFSTSGASAGLAKHLRLRFERMLPQSLGALAAKLAASRDLMRARWRDGAERRRALDQALGEGGALDPFAHGGAERVDAWLADADNGVRGEVTTVILGSDDPEELTLRQARLLGMADAVLHDPDVAAAILDRSRADALRRPLPQDPAQFEGLVVVLKRA
ncbi:siroheme synthase [Erythrobacter sp. SDW2]|uniref:precorrin-2 dehydrogenase/sirohydrochlorin ferrochelatase family protein n=1 Tax=Erythrobacter sp. SDW2 TaxID=2907154 RepID=UPI001F39919F|nr:NAD(P)-dependent oxidoreductase [Erythrobacter sp. SDW2]UIP06437.1 siroheme synthase [Erythrobacter sp. SDW2]